ncbi:neuronal acetylcholine receptor subunit beta-4-like [Mizuhopecten yessoensis]|uniref:neuronal acetylcholine receptor subunit beta-4-like n=1 Tax=Mizuhopecten yessoensis TaxID=6573 RepID=UPI000B45C71F|nr:neuronal acetylcholine receptor subunit beta-4-like [Mizuhopecten yessoensis]
MVGEIQMDWKDELVIEAFNESYHTFQEISLPFDFIWTPTISIFNSVDLMAATLGNSAHFVRINMTSGDIKWTFGVVSKTGCSVDATNYPFDVQKCTLIFTPRGYTNTEIDFNIQESSIRTDEFAGSEEWNITETAVNMKVVKTQAFLLYRITLSRKPTFFMINIVLPIFLLAILNTLVFLLPAETGERIGYAIAAFLTFAVFLSLMSASLPQASLPMPLLSYYMLIMLLLSSTITFVSVFNLRFHFAKTSSPVPKYLKTLVERTTFRNRPENCSGARSKNDVENAVSNKKSSSSSETMSGQNNVGSGKNVREIVTDQKSVCKVDWKMVGKTLDKIFLILYWSIYICVSLVFYLKVQQQVSP